MDQSLINLLMFTGGWGLLGSLLGLIYALFGRGGRPLRVEIATGVGFLVGASLGMLYGIMQSMLGRF